MKTRVFAVGDIHGCFKALQLLLEEKIALQKSDKLILLGDYIDRGSQSKAVIDYILNLQSLGYDVVPLMGNHEAMLLEASTDDRFLVKCLLNGGGVTLESFAVQSYQKLPEHYLNFFRQLPYYYALDDFLFVHAGFNDEVLNPFLERYSMLWKSRDYYTHPFFSDKTIVHGHFPITKTDCEYQIHSNRPVINVDTGCVYGGVEGYGHLSAIEIHSMILYSV